MEKIVVTIVVPAVIKTYGPRGIKKLIAIVAPNIINGGTINFNNCSFGLVGSLSGVPIETFSSGSR